MPGVIRRITPALAYVVLSCAVLLAVKSTPTPSLASSVALLGFIALGAWMFLSENYPATLAVLLLYLGLLDGFLKLKTGLQVATLGRDILLYAIVAGAVIRFLIRKQAVRLPPLSGWVLAFALIVLVSMFNPGSAPLVHHALPSVRPHLEFLPLFFLGFLVVRTRARLRMFLILLLVCGAANGVVNLAQYNLSEDQLASWGPGYAKFIEGGDGIGGRTFATDNGDRVRPFGLGGDAGGGGFIAVLGLPGAIALVALARRRPKFAAIALVLSAWALVAVITSQGRGVVVGGFAMVLAYAALSVTARRVIPTVAAITVGGVVTLLVLSALTGDSSNSFDRYDTISPGKILGTTATDRGNALTIVPKYIGDFPLGYGLGSGGPAAGFGGAQRVGLSAESEFAYLMIEVGLVGLLIVVGFTLRLLQLAVTRLRSVGDHELRTLLAGAISPLFGIVVLFVSGAPTSGSPLGPYFWFTGGLISYWLLSARRQGAPTTPHRRADHELGPAI
ncbi:MAG TPA: hypothetical protein VJT68_03195 [Thermoleophilaceae bacterium]|nr:hypothetical protein [Thermoleophilaceae bacterium]